MATPEYYKSLPAKRMGSGALFFNSAGKILFVKPIENNYGNSQIIGF
jgi:hypothetical protein